MTKAELIATKVLEECGLADPTSFPLSDIILGRKAFYQERPLSGKEGEIISINGKSVITVNSNIEFDAKKRYVAAHELGHYEMHRKRIPIISDSEYDLVNWFQASSLEAEANEFASEFLMPSNLFSKECSGKYFAPKVIDYLAERFNVSKTATILKFIKSGNHPICVVYTANNKMKWWKKSPDFPYFLKFKPDTAPPGGSVVSEIFTMKSLYFGDDRKQSVEKDVWFEVNDRYQGNFMYEFCLYAKSYDYALSLLWED